MKTETKVKAARIAISAATFASTVYVAYLIGRGTTDLIEAARARIIGS